MVKRVIRLVLASALFGSLLAGCVSIPIPIPALGGSRWIWAILQEDIFS